MAELSPQTFAAALVFVLGVRWLFGTPILKTGQVIALFVFAVISALASLIVSYYPPQAPSYGGFLALVAASSLPAFAAFVAGFGYRRYYRVVYAAIIVLFLLICLYLLPLRGLYSAGTVQILDGAERLLTAGFLGYATTSYWMGRHDDLDLRRRQSRYVLAPAGGLTSIAALVLAPGSLVLALAITALLLLTSLAILYAKREPSSVPVPDYDEKLEQLSYLFEKRRLYREDDLTLERIGDRLLLDNSKVRFLIHYGLGYRRLSDLLDDYRIAAAREQLSEIEEAQTPLEEIAISVGYGSRPPFEEAFLRKVGETPSAFRQHQVNLADANRPLQLTNTDR